MLITYRYVNLVGWPGVYCFGCIGIVTANLSRISRIDHPQPGSRGVRLLFPSDLTRGQAVQGREQLQWASSPAFKRHVRVTGILKSSHCSAACPYASMFALPATNKVCNMSVTCRCGVVITAPTSMTVSDCIRGKHACLRRSIAVMLPLIATRECPGVGLGG